MNECLRFFLEVLFFLLKIDKTNSFLKVVDLFPMVTCRNVKGSAVNRGGQEAHPGNTVHRDPKFTRINEEYITQVAQEIERIEVENIS